MTPAELVALAIARHGDDWKGKMADETGWSWWTFHRIEQGKEVSPKLAKAVQNLKPLKRPRKA